MRNRSPRTRRGAAAVEFVLTFPVIFLLFVSTIEFGNYFADVTRISSATQSGARFGSRQTKVMVALTRAATSTTTAMADLGYNCSGFGASCEVKSRIVNVASINYVEVTARIPYKWVTQSNDGDGRLFGVVPRPDIFTRAIYPHVGDMNL